MPIPGTAPAHARLRRTATVVIAAISGLAGVVVGAETLRAAGDAVESPGRASFSRAPDPLPPGAPGTIVRDEELIGAPLFARGWRLMYHSTDLHGADVLSTGVLIAPLSPAPPGGRIVVSWAHPTTGSAMACAPSLQDDPFLLIEGLRTLLDRGYAVVATDYTGMGVEGPDSYLVGATEAHNVLDAVRAAQHVEDAHVGNRVVLWGHSQGGQAVLRAAEEAADYAPELRIDAVAAAAPAADLGRLVSAHLDDISGVTIGSYAFAAYAQVYADVPGTQLESVLTPQAVAISSRMNALCLLSDLGELHRIGQPLVGRFFRIDPTTAEPWKTLLQENSAGGRAFDAPLFLAQGSQDTLVIPADTRAFAVHERALGIAVTYDTIPLADHGTVAYLALPALTTWLDEVIPAN